MKKRWIALCLTAMLAAGVTGCGGTASSGEGDGAATTKTESAAEKDGTLDIAEGILYDQGDFKVTATGYKQQKDSVYDCLVLEVENNTDETVIMDTTNLGINGLRIESEREGLTTERVMQILSLWEGMYETKEDAVKDLCSIYGGVPAGETQEVELKIEPGNALKKYMGEVQLIDISISPAKLTGLEGDEEIGTEEMPVGEKVTLETEAYKGELVFEEPEGTEIYNQDGVRIVVLDMDYDEEYEQLYTNLYISNDSGQRLTFEEGDMSVNDFVVSGYVEGSAYERAELESGQKVFGSMKMREAAIEGVDDVENMEFAINVTSYESGNWGGVIGTATYTYTK